jgi:predicted secreted acid phosphatase
VSKVKLIRNLVGFLLLSFGGISGASGLPNLDIVKGQLIAYHDSGEYAADIAAVNAKALAYLQKRVAEKNPSEKLAVVLDIDETSLSNYPDMVRLSFGGTFADIVRTEDRGRDLAIPSTLAIYQYAKAHGVAVFFITGRVKSSRAATISNLEKAGYVRFDGLTMKPDGYREVSVVPYKSSARKEIAEKGYVIVLNIGDQVSDLVGGYSERVFKLPNPYYFIR